MKNIIVTAANSPYFNSLATLVASIHRHSFDLIDQIFIFDIGLSQEDRSTASTWSKVSIVDLPNDIDSTPKQHVYKCYCVHWAKNQAEKILWLDAGVMLLKSIDQIFKIIQDEDIFLVGDPDHKNERWTHEDCRLIMKATQEELGAQQLSSGILGYKSQGGYQQLIDDAYAYSKINGCVEGCHSNHRHDQSVYSILAARYKCNLQNIDTYGYWTDGSRNLNTAKEIGATIFVHRNGHWDFSGLLS